MTARHAAASNPSGRAALAVVEWYWSRTRIATGGAK